MYSVLTIPTPDANLRFSTDTKGTITMLQTAANPSLQNRSASSRHWRYPYLSSNTVTQIAYAPITTQGTSILRYPVIKSAAEPGQLLWQSPTLTTPFHNCPACRPYSTPKRVKSTQREQTMTCCGGSLAFKIRSKTMRYLRSLCLSFYRNFWT